jgi:glycosyltransferase involved in cell wall biosynthesis
LIREQKIDDLCLVLTGAKGWDYDRIFGEIANSVDVQDKIILTGYVPDEDLSPLYSGALAFVYPSLYEGFGLPPLEAMQCGTPVITSNTSSLPEVVGDAGIMVAPTDSDALCQAMLDLYCSDALRRDLAQKSLLRAKQFSWQKTTRETINAYKKALNG